MTITDSTPPGKVTMRLQMFKPFAADNVVEFTLVPRGATTDVTWAMQGRQPYLAKVMCLFFDMDKMVGTDFAAGLASLKALVERPVPRSIRLVIPLAGLELAAEHPEHEHRVAEHHRQQQRGADQHEHL